MDERLRKSKEEEKDVVSGPSFEHNLEFLVDPFFKKTTQMFDEANASGMLMNNLLIKPNHMLSLDSTINAKSKLVKSEIEEFKGNS